jgi:hypothetical protein
MKKINLMKFLKKEHFKHFTVNLMSLQKKLYTSSEMAASVDIRLKRPDKTYFVGV